MRRATLEALTEVRRAGRAVVRAVNLTSGDERLVDPTSDTSLLGVASIQASRADKSGPVEVEGQEWFLEVYNPPLDLVIVGAAHIAQPLATMACLADYKVRIIDPRTAFATLERFPDVSLSHDWPDEALSKAPLGPRSALVALAHDPKIDDPALSSALRSSAFYVGALGSRKTHSNRLDRFKSLGFSDTELARIRGPIGLAIGARSPAEIAISIMAQMTRDLRMGSESGSQ
jgi:xanthine dehydrogenase accessory factor